MEDNGSSNQNNILGNASLYLGIASLSLVFGIGLCALVGMAQNWFGEGSVCSLDF
jgi:hypothetical protein